MGWDPEEVVLIVLYLSVFVDDGCECRVRRLKNFVESEGRDTLSYTETHYHYFDHNSTGSGLAKTDVICTINIPLMVCTSLVPRLFS